MSFLSVCVCLRECCIHSTWNRFRKSRISTFVVPVPLRVVSEYVLTVSVHAALRRQIWWRSLRRHRSCSRWSSLDSARTPTLKKCARCVSSLTSSSPPSPPPPPPPPLPSSLLLPLPLFLLFFPPPLCLCPSHCCAMSRLLLLCSRQKACC